MKNLKNKVMKKMLFALSLASAMIVLTFLLAYCIVY